MDCANFDALDDKCKGCLSGGTSVDPKEQECYEIPVKIEYVLKCILNQKTDDEK